MIPQRFGQVWLYHGGTPLRDLLQPHGFKERVAPFENLEHDFLLDLNPDSVKLVRAQLEPSLGDAKPEQHFQFERHGYFIRDRDGGFNRTVTLRDSWK